MCTDRSAPIVIMVVLLIPFGPASFIRAGDPVNIKDLSPKGLGFAFVEQRVDDSTGFVVGGRNETEAIKRLTSLNGRSIVELERVMRPGANSSANEGSGAGFLGKDERLLDVLAMDNAYVVDDLALNHRDLARPLLLVGHYAIKHARKDGVRIKHGDRDFLVNVVSSRGYQVSPFLDGTKTNTDVTIKNLDDGTELKYSLLVPYMIERYGFYEGRGTPFRVDPRAIVDLLGLSKADGT